MGTYCLTARKQTQLQKFDFTYYCTIESAQGSLAEEQYHKCSYEENCYITVHIWHFATTDGVTIVSGDTFAQYSLSLLRLDLTLLCTLLQLRAEVSAIVLFYCKQMPNLPLPLQRNLAFLSCVTFLENEQV